MYEWYIADVLNVHGRCTKFSMRKIWRYDKKVVPLLFLNNKEHLSMILSLKHHLLIWLLAIAAWTTAAAQERQYDNSLDALYKQIDEAIEQSPDYVADYEAKVQVVKNALARETNAEQQMFLAGQLFQLYRAFNNDSALNYISQAITLADRDGRADVSNRARAQMAFQCSTVGMYTEALSILDGIDRAALDSTGRCDYYVAQMHVYGELAYYTRIGWLREHYYDLQHRYRDSLFAVASPQSEPYMLRQETELLTAQRFQEALAANDRRRAMTDSMSHEFAIVAYYRHLIMNAMHQPEETRRWLALSALSDIRQAVMDQASLITLAELLNSDGDFDRSYRYIRFTWDCNNRFNTRMRSWQITPILNVIERNYQNEMKQGATRLRWALIGLSLMGLIILASLIVTLREKRKLTRAQAQLSGLNDELRTKNDEQAALNAQLQSLNARLQSLNAQLSESNRVKEEYIGRFMSLCSEYINKLDDYRKMVQRKMKQKELDELFRITKSTELKEKELDELYENFDSVFLHLFPSFIDEFNALLSPEVQVRPKEDHRLTTDLRIFALIRLGIEDSSKIAEFLHYSVNTIYNYRARIKNGALGERDDFERRVKALGLPRQYAGGQD